MKSERTRRNRRAAGRPGKTRHRVHWVISSELAIRPNTIRAQPKNLRDTHGPRENHRQEVEPDDQRWIRLDHVHVEPVAGQYSSCGVEEPGIVVVQQTQENGEDAEAKHS